MFAEYVVAVAPDVAELVELAEYVAPAAVDVAVLLEFAEYVEAVATPAVPAGLVDAAAFVAFSADVAAVRFAFFACRHCEDAAFAAVRATV